MAHPPENTQLFEYIGNVAMYRDWRRRVEIYHAGVPDDKRHLTAPTVFGYLRGDADDGTRQRKPEELRDQGAAGRRVLHEFLDTRYGWQPEPFFTKSWKGYLYFASRKGAETITGFLARSRSAMERFVQNIKESREDET